MPQLQISVSVFLSTSRAVCYRMIDWKKGLELALNYWMKRPWKALNFVGHLAQEPCSTAFALIMSVPFSLNPVVIVIRAWSRSFLSGTAMIRILGLISKQATAIHHSTNLIHQRSVTSHRLKTVVEYTPCKWRQITDQDFQLLLLMRHQNRLKIDFNQNHKSPLSDWFKSKS